MEPLNGTYIVELDGGYDFVEVTREEAETLVEDGERVEVSASGALRHRVYREADPETGAFASAMLVIQEPAQIPLNSLVKYVERAVLANSAPAESIRAVRPDMERSTAEPSDVHNVGRKIAAMCGCDYVEDEEA
jgi:hypothetical protein